VLTASDPKLPFPLCSMILGDVAALPL